MADHRQLNLHEDPGVDPTVRPAASIGRMNSRTSLLMVATASGR